MFFDIILSMRFFHLKSIFVFIFLSVSFSAFANVGFGGSFSYNVSTTPSEAVSFTVRSDKSPWGVFLNAHLKKNIFSVFVDDWFVNERIAEHADYFVLWGISGGCRVDDGIFEIATGSRFGAGLDFFFFKRHLEFFAQAVWNPYFGVKKEDGGFSPIIRPLNFPCSAGLRIWF